MNREDRLRRILLSLNRYLVFFLLTAFIITCCMSLFITLLTDSAGIELTGANMELAAKLTFINVIFLSLVFTLMDGLRRKLTVDRPMRHILEAAQRIIQGDFSARIPPNHSLDWDRKFDEIIACFNKMAQELSSTETLRTDFVANVSHELKTPLAVIQNYSVMLQKPGLSEDERRQYSKAISDTSRRLADLISNILRLNKLENQQLFPTASTYDLGEQLCECLLAFEESWEARRLEIETDIQDGVLVRNDSDMLTLVWNNLFSNAIKFTDEGGTIGLKLFTEGPHAVVQISDTGCGISPEVGRHMFDKFYQGDTSHAGQGNGLGLALVKRVVDITGSEIAVESKVGQGTVFTVKIRREAS